LCALLFHLSQHLQFFFDGFLFCFEAGHPEGGKFSRGVYEVGWIKLLEAILSNLRVSGF